MAQSGNFDEIIRSADPSPLFESTALEDEVERHVFDGHEVAILSAILHGKRGLLGPGGGHELVVMNGCHWYSVDVPGGLAAARGAASRLVAPTFLSNGLRMMLDKRTVHLSEDVALATAETTMSFYVLHVWSVPRDSAFATQTSYRLSLCPGIIVPLGEKERNEDWTRKGKTAWLAKIIDERERAFSALAAELGAPSADGAPSVR
ncbi:hypothetical protein [Aureimonas pseudogalii]|uniref:Uncharacterized protein n=1 Tax=Aureimonas pseudogalii TaxID=1744844 RepID=A0A7W6EBR3_9HYPH|nr:hypothetical protein [Aureimonas pseudogalii]MBB3998362.1 hypothetical protein [Aureimonas pseudogalii]